MSDIVERAKAALEGVTAGPWLCIPGDDEEATVISEGERSPDAITVGGATFNPGFSVAVDLRNGDAEFIVAARTLVAELVAEVERLRAALPPMVQLSTSSESGADLCDVCGCWAGGAACPYCDGAPHPRGRA